MFFVVDDDGGGSVLTREACLPPRVPRPPQLWEFDLLALCSLVLDSERGACQ